MLSSLSTARRICSFLTACLPMLGCGARGAGPLTFEKDIRPILKTNCFQCHGEDGEKKGDLDVRLARFIMKGGESGPDIVPGDASKSHLLELVKKGEMPKKKA